MTPSEDRGAMPGRQPGFKVPVFRWLQDHPWLWALIGCLITLLGFLFGQGLLLQPHIVLTAGQLDLAMPHELRLRLILSQQLMLPPRQMDEFRTTYRRELLNRGMPPEKVKKLMMQIVDVAAAASTGTRAQDLRLESHEQRIQAYALASAQVHMATVTSRTMLIPDRVVFVEIRNSGRAHASSVRAVLSFPGSATEYVVDPKIFVDRATLNDGTLEIALQDLPPGSVVRIRAWYAGSSSMQSGEIVNVAVSHKAGTSRHQLPLGWPN